MGLLFSSPLPVEDGEPEPATVLQDGKDTSKRPRFLDEATGALEGGELRQEALIPGLPDEVALQCLARVPRAWQGTARYVCKPWREVLMSAELHSLRRDLACTEEWLYIMLKDEAQRIIWRAWDPMGGRWFSLPSMPDVAGLVERNENHENSSWWRTFAAGRLWNPVNHALEAPPFCGCTPASLKGILYVIGGFSRGRAISRVLRYDPRLNAWDEGPSLEVARAYCKVGVIDGRLYVVGGVSHGDEGLEPLASAEMFDPTVGSWRRVANMTFSRAPPLPAAFLAEVLRPTATGLAVVEGRLCVTQSLYHWPFFIDIGGEIYNPETDVWTEMPQGMGEGWPVRQGGSKVSAVVDNRVYGLDPNGSRGALVRTYDKEMDAWKRLALAPLQLGMAEEAPFLLACVRGHLYALMKDTARFVILSSADVSKLRDSRWLDGEEDLWRQEARCRFGRSELVACEVVEC